MIIDAALLQHCAPQMHQAVSYAIVKTESRFNPFAIGINEGVRLKSQPKDYQQAVILAKQLLADGKNIDLGLAQINSSNLRWLGLSVEQAFHPCVNLQAMQTVYLDCLKRFGGVAGRGTAIQRAWSCYNTGSATKGFSNGYVAKVTNHYNELAANYARRQAHRPEHQLKQIQVQTPHAITDAPKLNVIDVDDNEQSNKTEILEENQLAIQPKLRASWDVFGEF